MSLHLRESSAEVCDAYRQAIALATQLRQHCRDGRIFKCKPSAQLLQSLHLLEERRQRPAWWRGVTAHRWRWSMTACSSVGVRAEPSPPHAFTDGRSRAEGAGAAGWGNTKTKAPRTARNRKFIRALAMRAVLWAAQFPRTSMVAQAALTCALATVWVDWDCSGRGIYSTCHCTELSSTRRVQLYDLSTTLVLYSCMYVVCIQLYCVHSCTRQLGCTVIVSTYHFAASSESGAILVQYNTVFETPLRMYNSSTRHTLISILCTSCIAAAPLAPSGACLERVVKQTA